jgi:hypothetical protein
MILTISYNTRIAGFVDFVQRCLEFWKMEKVHKPSDSELLFKFIIR